MKRIINKLKNKKEYFVYPLIGVLIALYEFGSETTIEIIALIYVMVIPTLNTFDLYILITGQNTSSKKRQVLNLIITTGLIVFCYYLIGEDLRRLAIYLAVGLLVISIFLVSLYKVYFKISEKG